MAGEEVTGKSEAIMDKLAARVRNIDGKPSMPRQILKKDGGNVGEKAVYDGKHDVGMDKNVIDGKVDDNSASKEGSSDANVSKGSYASVTMNSQALPKVNFRLMESIVPPESDVEVCIPLSSVEEVANRLQNTVYGYFLGKREAFPVVENFVRNNWAKFGLEKVSIHKLFFFFKFNQLNGVEDVLQNGPWMIRGNPIILNRWTPSVSLAKEEMTAVPVWVKMHDVPLVAFTSDSISMLASRIGNPIMLDTYTKSMCLDSWGRSSYARAMVEVTADQDLKETISVAVPRLDGSGYLKEAVMVEYEWKPPRCKECKTFGHVCDNCPKKCSDKHE